MPDKRKASYPAAPIAWMSQAYSTTSTPSSPVTEQKLIRSATSQSAHTSTLTSLER